jgi:hypothetical protein
MRGLLASLSIAILFVVVALITAAFGAVGVAFIGSLLHRWFDLTQWQGTLIALTIAFGLAVLVYKLVQAPVQPSSWEEQEEEECAACEIPDAEESPIVPWRRSRPTPGELPASRTSDVSKPGNSAR